MRVVFVPRSAEIKPWFWRFVLTFHPLPGVHLRGSVLEVGKNIEIRESNLRGSTFFSDFGLVFFVVLSSFFWGFQE
jgi:hypothetical protein